MNPLVNLAPASGNAYAYIETLGSKERYDFQLNPSESQWEFTQKLENHSIIGANNPISVPQATGSKITLSFRVYGEGKSVRPLLDGLVRLTRFVPGTLGTPDIRYCHGLTVIPQAKLETVTYKVTETRGGDPIAAECSATLVTSGTLATPLVEKIPKKAEDKSSSEELSTREISQGIEKIKPLLKGLGFPANATITLNAQGVVTIQDGNKPRKEYKYKDLVK